LPNRNIKLDEADFNLESGDQRGESTKAEAATDPSNPAIQSPRFSRMAILPASHFEHDPDECNSRQNPQKLSTQRHLLSDSKIKPIMPLDWQSLLI